MKLKSSVFDLKRKFTTLLIVNILRDDFEYEKGAFFSRHKARDMSQSQGRNHVGYEHLPYFQHNDVGLQYITNQVKTNKHKLLRSNVVIYLQNSINSSNLNGIAITHHAL